MFYEKAIVEQVSVNKIKTKKYNYNRKLIM